MAFYCASLASRTILSFNNVEASLHFSIVQAFQKHPRDAITLMIPTSTPKIVVLLNVSRERQLHTRIPVSIHALEIYVSNLMPLLSIFFSFLLSVQHSIFQIYASRFTLQSKQMANHARLKTHCGMPGPNLLATRSTILLAGTAQ